MRSRFVEITVCAAVIVGVLVFCGALKVEMSQQGYPTTLEEAYPDSDDPAQSYRDDLDWAKQQVSLEIRRKQADRERRARYAQQP